MEYIYIKENSPNLDTISELIFISEMENKSLEYCMWEEKAQELKVVFTLELSNKDKELLDTIVE